MIGSGLKKLANERGLSIDKGVVYGNLGGYAVTMFDGAGTKTICVTTTFTDPALLTQLQTVLNSHNLIKDFRVANISFAQKQIIIVFQDNPGTMKKIEAFIDWFFPLLPEHGATGVDICPECGCDIVGGTWKLIDGIAYHFHESCAEKVKASLADEVQTRKEEDKGSYLTGLIGAVIGAAVGGVLWAVVYLIGYVASIVGLVIGWLSERGYRLARGKQGKGKVAILIVAIIFGVVFGTLLGDGLSLAQMIKAGELPGYAISDIPYIFSFLFTDGEYVGSFIKNIGIALLFAALGVFAIIRRSAKEVAPVRVQDLK